MKVLYICISGDLYEVVRKGRGLTVPCPVSPCRHGMLATPPSDDEMAAWLYPIISHGDQKPAVGDDDVVKQNDRPVVSSVKATMNKQLKEKKLSTTPKKNLARVSTCINLLHAVSRLSDRMVRKCAVFFDLKEG